jgi:hypothetical protein
LFGLHLVSGQINECWQDIDILHGGIGAPAGGVKGIWARAPNNRAIVSMVGTDAFDGHVPA